MNHRRKLLIATSSWSALALTGAAFGQPKQAPIVIGWLVVPSRATNGHYLAAFKEGLAALVWKESSQFVIEERWTNGRYDRLRSMAAELAAKKPALIVAARSQSIAANLALRLTRHRASRCAQSGPAAIARAACG